MTGAMGLPRETAGPLQSAVLGLARAFARLPRGGWPLVRTLGKLFPQAAPVVLETHYGRVACDLRESVCYELLQTGRYHHWNEEERFVREFGIGPDTVVFDVGANIGLFALLFAQHGARVYAFEPSRRALALLRRNAALYPKITVVPHAVSAERGSVSFLEKPMTNLSGFGEGGELVEAVTLDDQEATPDLIKIDVEGFEHLVLAGAKRHLRAGVPVLFEALDAAALQRNTAVIHGINPSYAVSRLGGSCNYLARMS